MMKKFLGFASVPALAIGALVLGTNAVGAVDSATTTLDSIMTVIIATTVELATTIFTTYWPYILVFGVIAGLVGVFARFVKIGGSKK